MPDIHDNFFIDRITYATGGIIDLSDKITGSKQN